MPTSQEIFLSEIVGDDAISEGKLEYFRSRLSNRFHEFIIDEFIRLSKEKNVTKADLARKIGKAPAQITRWLGEPGNWTMDTLSDLALGMGCEPSTGLIRLAEQQTATAQLPASITHPVSKVVHIRKDSSSALAAISKQVDGYNNPIEGSSYRTNASSTDGALREQQQQQRGVR